MRLEYLYPELGNVFGDGANMRYLRLCMPDADYVETHLGETPAFAAGGADFVYCGPMTERGQRLALERLAPYAEALRAQIDAGTHFLFTGNSLELLGKRVETEAGSFDCLGVWDFTARLDMNDRYNSLFLGTYADIEIAAFNSRFGRAYPGASLPGFAAVVRGMGLNPDCPFEGVLENNCLGTYLLGPLLPLNPLLTQRLLLSLGAKNTVPAHFDAAMAAYEKRRQEFHDPRVQPD